MKRWAWPVTKGVGALLAVGLLANTTVAAVRELSVAGVHVAPGAATLGLLVLAITYVGLADLWRRAARRLGATLSLGEAIEVWSFSNLGRYIPGKVWQVVGLVIVARDFGVGALVAGGVAVLVTALVLGTGALVGVALLPGRVLGSAASLAGVTVVAAGLVVIVASPGWLLRVAGRVPGAANLTRLPPPSRASMARLAAGFCAAWLAHGLAFFLFARSFAPLAWRELGSLTGAYVLAHVLGLVAIVAPGGIGVREEVLERLLEAAVGDALPVSVVAVGARVWTTAAELVVLALAVGLRVVRTRRGA